MEAAGRDDPETKMNENDFGLSPRGVLRRADGHTDTHTDTLTHGYFRSFQLRIEIVKMGLEFRLLNDPLRFSFFFP